MPNAAFRSLVRITSIVAIVLIATGPGWAQCTNSTTTTVAGGNGCSGNFFDILANRNLTICSFDVNIGAASQTIEVYAVTGGGSFVPVSGNPAAWTLLGTATVSGTTGILTPLNLSLNYLVPSGTTQGFVIRNTSGTGFTYTNGTLVGNPVVSNADITIFEGNYTCTTGTVFPVLTSLPRIWNGTIHYNTSNQLSVSQSGVGVGDLSVSLLDLSPSALTGWTLVSAATAFPTNSGPVIGIYPDATTFSILGYAYFPGNPFRFNTGDLGVYPNAPFQAGPGSVSGLAGITLDFVVLMLDPIGGYDSRSNVVRYTFQ